MKYLPYFDIAFVIHYSDGTSTRNIWNTDSAYYKDERLSFQELCEINEVSSIEILYKNRLSKNTNRSVVSVPNIKNSVKYKIIYRGIIEKGFHIDKIQYEHDNTYPKYLNIPGAIQINILAQENTETIAKMTIDHEALFVREV